MKILAFDTSGRTLSAAIFDGGRVVAETNDPAFSRHSETLAPALERLLAAARIAPSEIEAIGVGLGPGSFTGLRIAVATAQALAIATGAKLAGICGLAAVAGGSGRQGEIAVVQEARRGQVYASSYRVSGDRVTEAVAPYLTTFERAAEAFRRADFFTGDAALARRAELESRVAAVESDPEKTVPSAASVGRLALASIEAGRTDDPFRLTPVYVYPKECNVTQPNPDKGKRARQLS